MVTHTGKCPACGKGNTYVKVQPVEARISFGHTAYHAVSFQCPSCSTVLGVQIDPIALKTDIVKELLKALGRR